MTNSGGRLRDRYTKPAISSAPATPAAIQATSKDRRGRRAARKAPPSRAIATNGAGRDQQEHGRSRNTARMAQKMAVPVNGTGGWEEAGVAGGQQERKREKLRRIEQGVAAQFGDGIAALIRREGDSGEPSTRASN